MQEETDADTVILQLGLEGSVVYARDGDSELLFNAKEKDVALMSKQAWSKFGARPFEDATDGDADGGKESARV